MISGTLERSAGGRLRRVMLAALLALLVAAAAAPRADAKLRLTAGSGAPATGGPLGRVPVRLDIRGDGRPHDIVVRSPGSPCRGSRRSAPGPGSPAAARGRART